MNEVDHADHNESALRDLDNMVGIGDHSDVWNGLERSGRNSPTTASNCRMTNTMVIATVYIFFRTMFNVTKSSTKLCKTVFYGSTCIVWQCALLLAFPQNLLFVQGCPTQPCSFCLAIWCSRMNARRLLRRSVCWYYYLASWIRFRAVLP